MSEDEDVEVFFLLLLLFYLQITICTIKPCFICKIPPLISTDGHKAENWDKKPIWDGRLRIISKNNKLIILLEHIRGNEAGQLFAVCPIQSDPKLPQSVEYCLDSSRYFVLRIEGDKGKKAFLGLYFNTRDEAFDFKAALQHEQNSLAIEQKVKSFVENQPKVDHSLAANATIKLNLKSKVVKMDNAVRDEKSDKTSKIAPLIMAPPKATSSKKKQATDSVASNELSNNFKDMKFEDNTLDDDFNWGDFVSSGPAVSESTNDDPFGSNNSDNTISTATTSSNNDDPFA